MSTISTQLNWGSSYIVYDLHLDLPEGGLLDRKYQSWSANAIYDFLYANDEELEKAKSQVEQGLGQESDEQGESESGSKSSHLEETMANFVQQAKATEQDSYGLWGRVYLPGAFSHLTYCYTFLL